MPTPPELAALLRACKDEPADDLPRRVLADWLEEHGQAECAEFVRLQLRLRGDEYEEGWTPESSANRARELRLLREHAGGGSGVPAPPRLPDLVELPMYGWKIGDERRPN